MTRILSLDGGGTWALLQTRALTALYPGERGHAILSHFDFAVANSGGSIVLGGLLHDMTPVEIEAYFTNSAERAAIYVRTPRLLDTLLRLFGAGARYSTPAKGAKLRAVFGTAPLVSLDHSSGRTTHAVIVAFDYVRKRAFFFRSAPSPRFPTVTGVSIADAVHASTTAPVLYFDRPAEVTVDLHYPGVGAAPVVMQFWDGAVAGLNNPVAAAIAEAIAAGRPANDIAVLSLGSGAVIQSNNPAHRGDPDQLAPAHIASGAIGDVKRLAAAVIDDPPDFASFIAHTMLGGRGPVGDETVPTRIVRLNPLILGDFMGGEWRRPAWNDRAAAPDLFRRLQTLGIDAVAQSEVADIERLATAWLTDAAWNQPVRANFFQSPSLGLHAEIGHTRFSAAAAAARDLGLV